MGAVPLAFALANPTPTPPRAWSTRIDAAKALRSRACGVDELERWVRRFIPEPRAPELASVRSRDARRFLGLLLAALKRGHVAVEGSAEEIGRRLLRCSGRNVRKVRARLVELGYLVCVHQLDAAHAGEGRHQGYAPNTYALGPVARRVLAPALGRRRPLRNDVPINRTTVSETPPGQAASSERGPEPLRGGEIYRPRIRAATLTATGADELERRPPLPARAGGADQGMSGASRWDLARPHRIAQEPREGHSEWCGAVWGLPVGCTCGGAS